MSHAVFIQNPQSSYKDRPGERYHFPRQYLGMVRETVGDWVVFYEGRQGAFGYVGVQKVLDVIPDSSLPNHFYAVMEPGSLWEFETIVPRQDNFGAAFERALRGPDGRPKSGGANTAAVRRLSAQEFAAIVNFGLRPVTDANALSSTVDAMDPEVSGFAEAQGLFEPPEPDVIREEILTSRKRRDASFARMVKRAYGGRCAVSGLSLRNGGGRAEVQAAHIKPVKNGGPDSIGNGLALSGTLHWMFDRGLISIAEDHRILISLNKVPSDVAERLITPGQRLILPEDPRHSPNPHLLKYHREEIFGGLT